MARSGEARPGAGHDAGRGHHPVGWNRKENHDQAHDEMRENIEHAAAAKVPNVITFSGNRRGQADDEGKDNCAQGLKPCEEDGGGQQASPSAWNC